MNIAGFLLVWAIVSGFSAIFIWVVNKISGPVTTQKMDHIAAQAIVLLGMIIFTIFLYNQ